jgi:hypothetical protein
LQSLKVNVGFESVAAAATHSESIATSESDPKPTCSEQEAHEEKPTMYPADLAGVVIDAF